MTSKNNKEIKLEICVDSIASAMIAAENGASRLELCSALSEGGLTPSTGMLKVLKCLPITIPIYCMLRPRAGNDFVYTDHEIKAILTDLELLQQAGADGFVFGSLTSKSEINIEHCQQVVDKANGLPVTFHRAFDVTNPNKMHQTVKTLIDLGFKRLLTSGFRRSAHEGLDFIAELIAKHHRDIIIVPGAGITVGNIEEILSTSKCLEFHSSAKKSADMNPNSDSIDNIQMDCDTMKPDTATYEITSADVVRKMSYIAKAMGENN